MPFTPKNWENAPSATTPISAEALENLETRLSDYTDDRVDPGESGVFNVVAYGWTVGGTAAANGTASVAALAAAAAAGGGDVVYPVDGSYDTTIAPAEGVRVVGRGGLPLLTATTSATKLTKTGTGPAVLIANTSGDTREGIPIEGIHFDGTGLSGAIDGLHIDGTAGDGSNLIRGLRLNRCNVTNFPRHQVLIDGTAFHINFTDCSFHNKGSTSANDLVKAQQTKGAGAYVGQVSFHECSLIQASSTAGVWCWNGTGASLGNVRFYGGFVASEHGTAHGIQHSSGLFIFGTHVEASAATSNIGIRYRGSEMALIFPAHVNGWTTDVQIGDPGNATEVAKGAIIAGPISNVHIVAGGSRRGTIVLTTGELSGSPATITDERLTTDSVSEVLRLGPVGPSNEIGIDFANEQLFLSSVNEIRTLSSFLANALRLDNSAGGGFLEFSGGVAAAGVPNNSIFRDSADNVLKRKDNTGGVAAI